jgi:electron transfer flavoprotein beta subunit
MKAKKKELLSIPAEELTPPEARQQTISMAPPEKKGRGLILEGDPADLAEQLIQLLKEKTTVLN